MTHRSCSTRRTLFAVAVLAACSSQKQVSEGNDASAPSNLVAGPLGGGVHLTWHDNSSNEELFEIERSEDGSAEHLLSTVPFDAALYHDADVTFGVHYQYRVRAKLPSGYSAYSNQAELTLIAPSGTGGGANGGSSSGGAMATGGGSTSLSAGSGGTQASGGQPNNGGSSPGGD
ncbi:MAG TPA: fibronectin type III domain-containing protein, partial [Polyangiaceae bacterium]|nr:fibronectin type III domain-containing protein [Polyangiaceae bacterium]